MGPDGNLRTTPPRDQGFGLRSMVQRVRSVGGAMELETAPGEGTAISVRVPAIPMVAS
ncbi:hypothetical protein O7621_00470 [Solwaraspora sp. WMMD937]|uniref:hypothetical protein n=1 Tax=Solwaraspora sp. WMMD937 TaxID=3016090 RepID=UPI00249C372D|nr:hypothetical protein [Solwaraspora sp. WMMD937]WFE21905.1 hypothetical protein O7621_00470 [Solwaraspora sp. WMMD937]